MTHARSFSITLGLSIAVALMGALAGCGGGSTRNDAAASGDDAATPGNDAATPGNDAATPGNDAAVADVDAASDVDAATVSGGACHQRRRHGGACGGWCQRRRSTCAVATTLPSSPAHGTASRACPGSPRRAPIASMAVWSAALTCAGPPAPGATWPRATPASSRTAATQRSARAAASPELRSADAIVGGVRPAEPKPTPTRRATGTSPRADAVRAPSIAAPACRMRCSQIGDVTPWFIVGLAEVMQQVMTTRPSARTH